jgi:hypothetical protein
MLEDGGEVCLGHVVGEGTVAEDDGGFVSVPLGRRQSRFGILLFQNFDATLKGLFEVAVLTTTRWLLIGSLSEGEYDHEPACFSC